MRRGRDGAFCRCEVAQPRLGIGDQGRMLGQPARTHAGIFQHQGIKTLCLRQDTRPVFGLAGHHHVCGDFSLRVGAGRNPGIFERFGQGLSGGGKIMCACFGLRQNKGRALQIDAWTANGHGISPFNCGFMESAHLRRKRRPRRCPQARNLARVN